jgi:ribonucleoside-diphosphate reductase alpha chain
MKSNEGYIKIVAIMQKFFDQAISGNWSYNPENYPDNEVPLSEMAKDMLNSYKYGWKTVYYQNTYDSKTEDEIEVLTEMWPQLDTSKTLMDEDEDCESGACAI